MTGLTHCGREGGITTYGQPDREISVFSTRLNDKDIHQENVLWSKFHVCMVKLTISLGLVSRVIGRHCWSSSRLMCRAHGQVELRTSKTTVSWFFSPEWFVTCVSKSVFKRLPRFNSLPHKCTRPHALQQVAPNPRARAFFFPEAWC